MAEEKRQFPTEMVDLPSKGHFYPKNHPLSSGQVEIKYMTAREEDILTSTNLINKGLVLDKLLEALIVSEDVNLNDILIGDKNAIMLASRVLAYGKDYTFEWVDESSGETKEETIDLTSLPDKEIDFGGLELNIGACNDDGTHDTFYDGMLDEVAIFNKKLSSSEVTAIYNSGTPKDESLHDSLFMYYRFEDNVNDTAGTSHGTNNGAVFGTSVPS